MKPTPSDLGATPPRQRPPGARPGLTLMSLLMAAPLVLAAPGAHGPNGEHLDSPPSMRSATTLPRIEVHSEIFELVGEVRPGELSIYIDRYDTNAPVLDAQLEIEAGGVKAAASFRAAQGDYVTNDASLLTTLAAKGAHTLVFTLVTPTDSDLLEGTLVAGTSPRAGVAADPAQHDGHDHALERALWWLGGIVAAGLLGGMVWRRVRTPASWGARP